jgi:fructose-bisphosphate aldolase class II
MALVSSKEILVPAREGGYAVGAFNTSNLEITQAILEAAHELKAPVIIATSSSAIKYAGFDNIYSVVENLAESLDVRVALHLDHGADFDICQACLDHGWTSVMIDASKHEFEENVRITKSVVEAAHRVSVPVEAELGKLMGIEDEVVVDGPDASLTDPGQAQEFVERTGCDFLAVAIGTSHGAYKFKGEPRLDIDRLSEIASRVDIPLVLHGASSVPQEVLDRASRYGAELPGAKGVPLDAIKQAIGRGIAKINIDTDLRLAFTGAVRQILADSPEVFDPRKIIGEGREAIKQVVKSKIEAFGSAGKV